MDVRVSDKAGKDISLTEQKSLILQYARENGSVTRKEVEDLISAGTTKAFRLLLLKELCEADFLLCYAFTNDQPWLLVWSCTMWAKMPPLFSNCAGDPCSATAPSLSTTISSALETVRIR